MTTEQRLIEAAGRLLDDGGLEAVTLRAVGHATGLSHNAPYKHFASRSDLLLAVAAASFSQLAETLSGIRHSSRDPRAKLMSALQTLTDYSRERPARYRLLFHNPDTAAAGGGLKEKAFATFGEFRAIVQGCQDADLLPQTQTESLTALIFATAQGLLAMEANGQFHSEKGLSGATGSLELLLDLLAPARK